MESDSIDSVAPGAIATGEEEAIAAQREHLADEALLEPSRKKLAGMEIRPFSAGSLRLARKLKLSIFDSVDPESLSVEERERQFYTFLYIQSQPVDTVLNAVRRPDFADVIERFAFEMPVDALPEIAAELNRVLAQAGSAVVEVHPRPGKPSGPPPPGNF